MSAVPEHRALVESDETLVKEILQAAKGQNHIMTDEEVNHVAKVVLSLAEKR